MEVDKKIKLAVRKKKLMFGEGGDQGSSEKKVKDKIKKSVKMESPSQSENICMEGMTAAELTMIRRLAGNDPLVRKKTFRKLKKWLSVLSQKVPETADCRSIIEPNFVRVWKALFYCMWMADKPLPQEQLADSISDLQIIFASKTPSFLVFVEWFVRTIAREWNWIDRFRMDKFMMLFRRFLRKSLLVISDKKWNNEILLGYLNIITTYIFNHHPASKGKKQQQPVTSTAPAPLGLQIHFIDIFMEELAKVGGENLKFTKTLKILTVFMCELGSNNDDRVLDEIRERIFNHLMRQSDVGIDYQEQLAFGGQEEEVEYEDGDANELGEEEATTAIDDELAGNDEDDEEEMENVDDGVLDPRAGAVDVVLPQLDVDYDKVYEKLIECGGQKDVKQKNRKVLYSLALQFKEITEGKYPLALPEDNYKSPALPRKELNKAAKRLLDMENVEEGGKRRKTKKMRKREAKRKLELDLSAASLESGGSEDQSQYINDDDLLDHVTDNYMSYIENEIKSPQNEVSEDTIDTASSAASAAEGHIEETNATPTPVKAKKDKNRKRKWKTEVEVETDEQDLMNGIVSKKGKAIIANESNEETIVIKKPKLRKRNSLGNVEKQNTPLIGKVRRLSELRTPSKQILRKNESPASANKRVSFILARNLEHEHADYPVSIANSPAIPYDKDKRPGLGLLKSPGSTPKSTPVRRAVAHEFF